MNGDSQALSQLLDVGLLPLIKLARLSMSGGVPIIQTHDPLVDDLAQAHMDLELVDVRAEVLELLAHLGQTCADALVAGADLEALAAGPDDHLEVLGVGEVEAGGAALVDLDGQHGALEHEVEVRAAVDVHGRRDDLVLDDELALAAGLDEKLGEGGVDRVLTILAILENYGRNLFKIRAKMKLG